MQAVFVEFIGPVWQIQVFETVLSFIVDVKH